MTRRLILRRRLHQGDDQGIAMIMVMASITVLALLVTAALGYALQQQPQARHDQDWNAALAAAQAGVDDYLSRLNQSDSYWQTVDCTNIALKGAQDRDQHVRLDQRHAARLAEPVHGEPGARGVPLRHRRQRHLQPGRRAGHLDRQGQRRHPQRAGAHRRAAGRRTSCTTPTSRTPTRRTRPRTPAARPRTRAASPARPRPTTGTRPAPAASRSPSSPVTSWTVRCTSTTPR